MRTTTASTNTGYPPRRSVRRKRRPPPWITPHLRALENQAITRPWDGVKIKIKINTNFNRTDIVDVASRKVLTHRVAITLDLCHAREVMDQALTMYGTPEVVDADQDSQFTGKKFTGVVLAAGCKLSMDGRGAWRDNVFLDRLWPSVKYKRVYLNA